MKPYQKKYRPKAGKKNTRWTDEDKARLRTLHEQGTSYYEIGNLLDRSPGAIAAQIYDMKRRDADEGYVHVAGGVTELSAPAPNPQRVSVAVTTQAPEPAKPDPYVLTDDKIKTFRLFDGVTSELWEEENPSLWTRIKRLFRK